MNRVLVCVGGYVELMDPEDRETLDDFLSSGVKAIDDELMRERNSISHPICRTRAAIDVDGLGNLYPHVIDTKHGQDHGSVNRSIMESIRAPSRYKIPT